MSVAYPDFHSYPTQGTIRAGDIKSVPLFIDYITPFTFNQNYFSIVFFSDPIDNQQISMILFRIDMTITQLFSITNKNYLNLLIPEFN